VNDSETNPPDCNDLLIFRTLSNASFLTHCFASKLSVDHNFVVTVACTCGEGCHIMRHILFRYERLQASEIRRRWPQWEVTDDIQAVYQADGGLVDAALANSTHVQLAEARGATIVENCRVVTVSKEASGIVVVSTGCLDLRWMHLSFSLGAPLRLTKSETKSSRRQPWPLEMFLQGHCTQSQILDTICRRQLLKPVSSY